MKWVLWSLGSSPRPPALLMARLFPSMGPIQPNNLVMKFAIIADIHSNLTALNAVIADIDAWNPDQVIVNGDTVNRGPYPRQCLEFVMDRCQRDGWVVTRGNHEDYVLDNIDPNPPPSSLDQQIFYNSIWTYQQLNYDVTPIELMVEQYEWQAPSGELLRATHAAVGNRQDGIYTHTSDDEIREKIGPPPAVFVTAHTHYPLHRQVGHTQIINSGGVGISCDGDTRASYAQIEWLAPQKWDINLVRVPYDLDKAYQDMLTSGFIADSGLLSHIMAFELRQGRPHLPHWNKRYYQAVLDGQLDLKDAVQAYLDNPTLI
ncbi:MAG TPA: metallophosphoesterase [Anaerolineae bacterium]|nr:metallophosphoesterase [Anaerolineae bacterium]